MSDLLRIVESRYERLEQIPGWDQRRLRRAQVLVAGAGALGNELLKHLALLGVGRIVIVDADRVEISNLSRSVLFRAQDRGRAKATVAAERLREINPDVDVLPVAGDLRWVLGLGLLRRMDLVLAGLDSIGSRIALNQMCWRAGVPWIDGALRERDGMIRVFQPPSGACFECGLAEEDYRIQAARYSCQLLAREATVDLPVPTTSTSASVVAAWQVQEAVDALHGLPLAAGRGVMFYGLTHQLFKVRYLRREGCPVHGDPEEVLSLPEASCLSTVAELRTALARAIPPISPTPPTPPIVEIELDRELVTAMSCASCGTRSPLWTPLFRLAAGDFSCPRCGGVREPHLSHRLGCGAEVSGMRLCELGIPPLHILTARECGGRARRFELTGDAAAPSLASFLRREEHDADL